MAYIEPTDVFGAWLETSKFTSDTIDAGLETLFSSRVIGRLQGHFDTSAWIDKDSSPSLVVQLIAMLYAASLYRRTYSEDLDTEGQGLNWAEWLEQTVEAYLVQLIDGTVFLDAVSSADAGLRFPAFYPTDDSSIDDPAKFTMSKEF